MPKTCSVWNTARNTPRAKTALSGRTPRRPKRPPPGRHHPKRGSRRTTRQLPNPLTHRRGLPPQGESRRISPRSRGNLVSLTNVPVRRASLTRPSPMSRPGRSLRRTRTGTLWPTGIGMSPREDRPGRAPIGRPMTHRAREGDRLSAAVDRDRGTKDEAVGAGANVRSAASVRLRRHPRRHRRKPGRPDNLPRGPQMISVWGSKANNPGSALPRQRPPPRSGGRLMRNCR